MKKSLLFFCAIFLLQAHFLNVNAQSPGITCPGNIKLSTSSGSCYRTVNGIDPVFTPSTALVSFTYNSLTWSGSGITSMSGMSFPTGVTTVTYSLSEYTGVSCSFTVTIVDSIPPVISCPIDFNVTCAKEVPPDYTMLPTATDNCGSVEIKFLGEVKILDSCVNRFIRKRTFSATDMAGNSSTCTQTITVYDNEPPRFNQAPPDSFITVACASNVPDVNPYMYTAEDDCIPDEEPNEVDVFFSQVKSDSTCPNRFTLKRTWTAVDWCGNQAVYRQTIRVADTIGPEFSITVDPSLNLSCASEIPDPASVTATDLCTSGAASVVFNEIKSDIQCANKFKLTRTWTATDVCGNTSSISQVITVNDLQAPVFNGSSPSPLTVSCEKDIPAVVAQTATDNCGSTPTITFSEAKSNIQCAGRFTLTRTWVATDDCGNSSTRTQVINVYDNEAPTLSNISVDTVVLWPPNHKMREITVNYTATDNCGATGTLSVTSNEPVHGGSDGDQSPDWEVIDDHHIRLRAEKANNGQARYYTIKVTVTDGCNTPVVDSVIVVVAHNITNPHTGNPFKVGSTVSFNGVFWDVPGNTHTAKWLIDGSAVANGTVTEPTGLQNGKIKGSYKFKSPGVYKLQMNVTDQSGITSYANTNEDLDAIVVIYDPNGGNAYGGGWFTSAAGALTSDLSATGKASFGFAVNYSNAAKPKGETQFEFKVGSFEFNALNFDYLSISGGRAQFRGTGRITGDQSGIGFIMTVTDGALDGSGIDRIRMKIYNRSTGYVYYDNQPGASEADDPATQVGTNSSIVIQGAPVNTNMITGRDGIQEIETTIEQTNKLQLIAYPNPSNDHFALTVNSADLSTKIQLQVFDQYGRMVEARQGIKVGSVISIGEKFVPGVYYVRIIQGSGHREIKLVKL